MVVIRTILPAEVAGVLAVAGLDARFGWSSVSYGWTGLGMLLMSPSYHYDRPARFGLLYPWFPRHTEIHHLARKMGC